VGKGNLMKKKQLASTWGI